MPSQNEILDELDRHYFGEESDEQDVIDQLPRLCDGCESFLDIGASLGQYTYFAAQAMGRGRVVALEADPLRYSTLDERSEEWASKLGAEISVIHGAAADAAGECEFYVTDCSVSGGMVQHPTADNDPSWRKVVVPSITIDDLWSGKIEGEESIRPDLIKIDVEGTELRVLKGAEKVLRNGNTKFLVEIHSWGDEERGYTPADVFSYMKGFGYRAKPLGRLFLFEKRPSLLKRAARWLFSR